MPVNSEKEYSGNQSARVIQGQHSRSNTPIMIQQTHNDVNRMDIDTAGHEQERYDETSSDLKNVLIKIASNKNEFSVHRWSSIASNVPGHTTLQHSKTVSDFVVTCLEPRLVNTGLSFVYKFTHSSGQQDSIFTPQRNGKRVDTVQQCVREITISS